MSILVLGTVALDTVKTPYGRRVKMLGGSAAHFSMSARLFTDVHLVAVVGRDFPAAHIDFLRRKSIVLTSLVRKDGRTFHWRGEYEQDMNCALTKKTELGVLADFCPAISPAQRRISNVFLANVDPDIQSRLLSCMHKPRLVGLDSMNYWIHAKRAALVRLLKRVDIFVANDREARDLSGECNLVRAAKRLRSLGPRLVLIKKGEHGVFFYCDDFMVSLPAFPTQQVIDPTGAGDTFAGGFMGYLSRGRGYGPRAIKDALAYGTIAASFNVESFGMERTGRLTKPMLDRRLAQFKRMVSW